MITIEPDPACQNPGLSLLEHTAKRLDVIAKSRTDEIVRYLLMAIVTEVDSELYSGKKEFWVVVAEIELEVVAPKANASRFRIGLTKISWDAIAALVIVKVRRKKRLRSEISTAEAACRIPRKAVHYLTEIAAGSVVTRPLAARISPKHPGTDAILQTGADCGLVTV